MKSGGKESTQSKTTKLLRPDLATIKKLKRSPAGLYGVVPERAASAPKKGSGSILMLKSARYGPRDRSNSGTTSQKRTPSTRRGDVGQTRNGVLELYKKKL